MYIEFSMTLFVSTTVQVYLNTKAKVMITLLPASQEQVAHITFIMTHYKCHVAIFGKSQTHVH